MWDNDTVFYTANDMELTRVVILALAFVIGCSAFPMPEEEQDMSVFFEHVDINARIVGGTQAAAGSHPHMVALSSGAIVRNYLCGGSIISARTVLTAAHCIAAVVSGGSLVNTLRGTVGTNRWNSGGTQHAFSRFVNHPNYVASTIKNDIGVLITSNNMANTALIRPIVVNYDWIGQGLSVRVAGWGRTATNGALSVNLLQLTTSTIDGNRCVRDVAQAAINLNMRAPHVDPAIELCTFLAAGRGTCNGDSGSALVRTDRGQQVGIVSWGLPCARGAPDMFVRVSAYRNWIVSNTA